MPKSHQKGLFIFHRDLRIVDNVGLIQAFVECEKVYTCFIFTPEQVGSQNKYRSDAAIRFMIESLEELSAEIHKHGGELIVLYGDPTELSRQLIRTLDISAVFVNKDYSPYAIERERQLSAICHSLQKPYVECADYYLYEPGSVRTGTGKYYQKYTPFYDAVIGQKVPKPYPAYSPHYRALTSSHITNKADIAKYKTTLPKIREKLVPQKNIENVDPIKGGRTDALRRLALACRTQTHYGRDRDSLVYETTRLSAHIKFGCISIREVYGAFARTYGRGSDIIRELIWREFFAHVLYGFPGVLGGYTHRGIRWRTSSRDLEKWKRGQTGFPLVDACMRQLNAMGYMHNRGRMVVANFLVKTLLINWKLGEEYFAQKLVDYDPASNNGNWQSISGTGVDQKPYFRDMNPWIQSAKFDPDAVYIKRWVPELADVSPKEIHKWELYSSDPKHRMVRYPKPMVYYGEQKAKMLEMYRSSGHS